MISIDFWQNRYDTGNMAWDLGGPSPHFTELLAQKPDFLKPGRIAVPGAGQGHDAALFGQAGFDVTGFDYTPAAVEQAQQRYGQLARFEQADIFTLADPQSPWAGQFDYILEHTCFCAILPKQRADYVQVMRNLLKPGGYLIGIFWEHGDPDGPPFNTTESEVQQFFERDFDLLSITPKQPASDRQGVERLVILQKKDVHKT